MKSKKCRVTSVEGKKNSLNAFSSTLDPLHSLFPLGLFRANTSRRKETMGGGKADRDNNVIDI
jgi:hypothetical protein